MPEWLWTLRNWQYGLWLRIVRIRKRTMPTKEEQKEATEALGVLEELLQDRISDLHQIKGAMAEHHTFVYYRALVWKVQMALGLRR